MLKNIYRLKNYKQFVLKRFLQEIFKKFLIHIKNNRNDIDIEDNNDELGEMVEVEMVEVAMIEVEMVEVEMLKVVAKMSETHHFFLRC